MNVQDSDGDFDPRWSGASIRLEHWHFHRRLFERYLIVLAPGEFSEMRHSIQVGRSPLIERLEGNRTVHSHRIARLSERIYVVLHKDRFVTVLLPTKRLNQLRRAITQQRRAAMLGDQTPVLGTFRSDIAYSPDAAGAVDLPGTDNVIGAVPNGC